MQGIVLLPYSNFKDSVQILDKQRLCDQRREAMIVAKLIAQRKGVQLTMAGGLEPPKFNIDRIVTLKRSHINESMPGYLKQVAKIHISKMRVIDVWEDYLEALKHYYNMLSHEWIVHRNHKHNQGFFDVNIDNIIYPYWLGDQKIHDSHKGYLYSKNKDAYKIFKDIPYYGIQWP